MKDISLLLGRAILKVEQYDSEVISRKIEEIPDVWCRLEDDSNFNWYLISKNNGKSVVTYYGYLSSKFPVALLMETCPDEIRKILSINGISTEQYCTRYSCDAEVLKRYVDNIELIDDSFLYDANQPFDEALFLKIDEGLKYINPRSFSFEELK